MREMPRIRSTMTKKRQRKEARKAQEAQVKRPKPTEGNPTLRAHAPDFKNQEHYYVICVGEFNEGLEDVAFYYIEHNGGTRVLPLFSSDEKATKYIEQSMTSPSAYMETFESIGTENQKTLESLQRAKYSIVPVGIQGFATVLTLIESTAFALDPGKGETQVLRIGTE